MSCGAPFLSLVAPAHNEQDCVAEFLREARQVLVGLGSAFEIVCVDDGSTDGTRAILAARKAEIPELRVVELDRRSGQSAALAAGIEAARGEVIALMDADLQNDPSDLPRLLMVLEGQVAVQGVVGRRRTRRDPLLRRWSSRIANAVAGWLLEDPVGDAGCGIKVFRASVLKRLRPFQGMHRFFGPLVRLEGAVVVEVEVNHRPRRAGRSKYGCGLGRTRAALVDALAVRWMQRRRLARIWKES